VLGLRADTATAEPERLARLIRALTRAMAWCGDPANHDELARLLAAPGHVDAPEAIIRRCLTGELVRRRGGPADAIADYLVFDRQGPDFPLASHGLWIYAQMVRWGHAALSDAAIATVRASFRPDLAAAALGRQAPDEAPVALPDLGRLDGHPFDPHDIAGYLAGLPIRATAISGPDVDH
jgi:NitT/TauT family transport system ATP-binding protein